MNKDTLKKEELNPTLENITSALEKIGWSTHSNGGGIECYYIKNHKDEYVDLELWFPKTDGRIETTRKDYSMPTIIFYLKDTILEYLDGGTAFSIRGKDNKDIFILFSNHDLK